MALYTILFGISIFLIALVLTIIKKMYFHWKKEHKIERMSITTVDRPAVSALISTEKCLLRRQRFAQDIDVYDVISKSDISIGKNITLLYGKNPPDSLDATVPPINTPAPDSSLEDKERKSN